MKTLFSLGFPGSFDFWQPQASDGSFLGQQPAIPTGPLTEDQKNSVIAKLKPAMTKIQEIDAWIHSVGEQQRLILGDSFGTFRGYIDFLAGLAEDVFPDYERMGSANPQDWWIPSEDAWKIERFIATADQAYQLYSLKVKGIAAPGPSGGAPGAPPAGVQPRATSSGVLPGSKILGIPSNDLLIGGGVAVGLGILLYALT
jgi:hypothetical protein